MTGLFLGSTDLDCNYGQSITQTNFFAYGVEVTIETQRGTHEIARSRLPGHSPGYATTIHRSQGSEYDKVMIILPHKDSKLLTRELLYVAASRAKREIILVGNPDSFLAAIESQDNLRSGVSTLLAKELD